MPARVGIHSPSRRLRQMIWQRFPSGSRKNAVFIASLSTAVSVFEHETLALELGPGCRHVIDPESHVANPALVDVRLTGWPADDLERHALFISQEEPRRITAALEHDLHAKRLDIKIFECGCLLSENREMFDSCHAKMPPYDRITDHYSLFTLFCLAASFSVFRRPAPRSSSTRAR